MVEGLCLMSIVEDLGFVCVYIFLFLTILSITFYIRFSRYEMKREISLSEAASGGASREASL